MIRESVHIPFPENEYLAEIVAFAVRQKRLLLAHWNENARMYDNDAMLGMANLWETAGLLFWLDELGYDASPVWTCSALVRKMLGAEDGHQT